MNLNLTASQKSALLEAGNIGSGHAAIALSQIMGRRIMIAMPSIEICQSNSLNEDVFGGSKELVQVAMQVKGDARGAMVFIMDSKMCFCLCDLVTGHENGTTKDLGDYERSAVTEVGNILSASYLNAISELTRLTLLLSAPDLSIGEAGLLSDFLRANIADIGDVKDVICVKTEFLQMDVRVEGYLLFLPDYGSVEKILSAMSV